MSVPNIGQSLGEQMPGDARPVNTSELIDNVMQVFTAGLIKYSTNLAANRSVYDNLLAAQKKVLEAESALQDVISAGSSILSLQHKAIDELHKLLEQWKQEHPLPQAADSPPSYEVPGKPPPGSVLGVS